MRLLKFNVALWQTTEKIKLKNDTKIVKDCFSQQQIAIQSTSEKLIPKLPIKKIEKVG